MLSFGIYISVSFGERDYNFFFLPHSMLKKNPTLRFLISRRYASFVSTENVQKVDCLSFFLLASYAFHYYYGQLYVLSLLYTIHNVISYFLYNSFIVRSVWLRQRDQRKITVPAFVSKSGLELSFLIFNSICLYIFVYINYYLKLIRNYLFFQNYFARNFYNMRMLALFVAFAINFILLFYKVNPSYFKRYHLDVKLTYKKLSDF